MHADTANLALYPASKAFDDDTGPVTLSKLLAGAGVKASADVTAPVTSFNDIARPSQTWVFTLDLGDWLPLSPANLYEWTFVIEKEGVGIPKEWRLAAGSFRPFYGAVVGNYLSKGGTLNGLGERSLAVQPHNPAIPRFDAFGYPTDWVPPTDATLLGGTEGESALPLYIRRAKESAQEATTAVQSAFENLLQQKQDDAAVSAAINKSQQVLKLETKSLCGDANPECKTTMVTTGIAVAGSAEVKAGCDADPTGMSSAAIARRALDCATVKLLDTLKTDVLLAQAVYDKRDQATQPSFAEYAGGALQQVFIDQWASLRDTRNAANEVLNANAAAKAKVDAADAALGAATAKTKLACSPQAMALAFLAGHSVSAGFPSGGSVSFSPGPLLAQITKCDELRGDLDVPRKQAIAAQLEAFSSLSSQASRFTEATRKLMSASATAFRLLFEARLAKDRADLETAVVGANAKSSFGVYRLLRSYDAWRARALLENARRFALTARRAIEGRYVVDLSTLAGAEPFVSSPAVWANEVYEYDLNMPKAVGLSAGKSDGTAIYPNRMVDYVGNLERFVNGYAVARPSAVTKNDADVVSLPGPEGFKTSSADPAPGDGSWNQWAFLCSDTGKWVGIPIAGTCETTADCSSGYTCRDKRCTGKADQVCSGGSRPSRAKIRFHLDPWGGLNTPIGTETFKNRYNARWKRLAINVVGTGVIDCSKTPDALTCYSRPFIRYDLTHVGPAWITGFDQLWRRLGVPLARMDGAKALAAERWTDPLTESFAKPYIAAVARDEFVDRPLGGAYDLDFIVGPELRLDRIERLQLLFEESYWVRGL